MTLTATSKASVFRAIAQARRSCKRFIPNRVIQPEVLEDILHRTTRSPSSFNLQPTQIILVQSENVKHQLADKAMLGIGNQYRTKDCSALAVFLADMEAGKRIERINDLERDWGARHPTYLAMFPLTTSFLMGEGHAATLLKKFTASAISNLGLKPMPQIEPIETWAYKNTSLVVQSYVLSATSHDLATSIMEGFDSIRMKHILRIPDRYGIPMVVATGFDYDDGHEVDQTPRLGLNEVVFNDSFGVPLFDENSSGEGQTDVSP